MAIGSVAVALCVIAVGAWQITKAQQAREAAAQQAAEQQRNEAVLEQEQRLDDTGHMTIIKQDGSVWSWGENRFGQIGNGTEKETVMPVQISTDAALISLGQAHTAMLRTDGSVWTWGDNSFGQLGNSSMSNSSSPVRVLEEADSVSAGAFHTAAVGTNGTLYVWGTDTDRLRSGGEAYITPTAVMENVKQAAAGRYFTVVLKQMGRYGHGAAMKMVSLETVHKKHGKTRFRCSIMLHKSVQVRHMCLLYARMARSGRGAQANKVSWELKTQMTNFDR